MKKNAKKLITLSISLLLATSSLTITSYADTYSNFTVPFSKNTSLKTLTSKLHETNDTIYINTINNAPIYTMPAESEKFKINELIFGTELNRIGTLDTGWSVILFENTRCYIKSSDITNEKDYTSISFYYDDVFANVKNNRIKLYTTLNATENYTQVKKNTKLYRLLSLDNGYSLVEFNKKRYFVKTSDLVKKVYLGKFQITYYCACNICNGGWGAVDCFGNPLKNGTAAVDTSIIPFGTSFSIQENGFLRECIAKDIGGAIRGKHIDVFVDVPHSVCEKMGNSYKDVYTFKKCE